MAVIEMICLANSKKYNEHCVAGLLTDGSGWVRPVSAGEHGSLSWNQIKLQDGSTSVVFDLVRLHCSRAAPKPHHPENRLISRRAWKLLARPIQIHPNPVLSAALVTGPELFDDCRQFIHFEEIAVKPTPSSLALIVPKDVQ